MLQVNLGARPFQVLKLKLNLDTTSIFINFIRRFRGGFLKFPGDDVQVHVSGWRDRAVIRRTGSWGRTPKVACLSIGSNKRLEKV